MIPREEQEMVFQEPESDCTNVVLATDIAESSITLPHVVAVIDLGLHRRVDFDGKSGLAALATKWISQAAAKQRAGRAGRTQPGKCVRMYTREFWEKCMPPFQPPEAQSMPLERLYLQSKQLADKLCKAIGGSAPRTGEALLKLLIQPPELASIHRARQVNADLGTIARPTEDARITSLGIFTLQMNMDLKVSRLVWLGILWGFPADAVVLGSVLSSMDPFSQPSPLFIRDDNVFLDKLRAATSARLLFDGGQCSEPLMQMQLFLEWLAQFHVDQRVSGTKEQVFRMRRRHTSNFSFNYSLSRGRMEHMINHVQDLALKVYRICDPSSSYAPPLLALLRGLGYAVNSRNDLKGITERDWKPFQLSDACCASAAVLKGLLAASFSDLLFVGSYGSRERDVDMSCSGEWDERPEGENRLQKEEQLLQAMSEHGFIPNQTVVFPLSAGDVEAYVSYVCSRKPSREPVQVSLAGAKVCLVELEKLDANRWQSLESRQSAPLLEDTRRLLPEFNLLAQYEKSMRDLKKATNSTGNYAHGVVQMFHPCMLNWEWLEPIMGSKGGLQRVDITFDRRNAPGFVSHVQELDKHGKLSRTVKFAVGALVTSGEKAGRAFPQAVTVLSADHLAFILSSAKLGATKGGLLRFGFTINGALAVRFRCFDLPGGCIDTERWGFISRLRAAIHVELDREESMILDGGAWRGQAPLLFDTPVKEHLQALMEHLCFEDDALDASEAAASPRAGDLPWSVIDLAGADGSASGASAFAPLAPWDELERRRKRIVDDMERRKQNAAAGHGWHPGNWSFPNQEGYFGQRHDRHGHGWQQPFGGGWCGWSACAGLVVAPPGCSGCAGSGVLVAPPQAAAAPQHSQESWGAPWQPRY
eukprot:TRINITY_DN14528_c0_g1_i1.p1 TRINITY_DN14528_c0_g1~~TRINITY_DN14528_c0_g1_i1.p1  ORF type:complete len:874 (+),score=163.95 TRINITY_DN14528_c0_g1_i1:34-2655(+)